MIDNVEVDLRSLFGPARDQGPRPTCLAHAVSAAHERARDSRIALSPEYLHFFSSGGLSSSGVTIKQAADTLQANGQPEEAHCPYSLSAPPVGWTPPSRTSVFRRASEIKTTSSAEVEAMIRASQAPILGIALTDSFYRPAAPWVISPAGAIRGLHAVAGVGLGRHGGRHLILVRNSWGLAWADAGYAWLDEDFVNRHLKAVMVLTHEVTV